MKKIKISSLAEKSTFERYNENYLVFNKNTSQLSRTSEDAVFKSDNMNGRSFLQSNGLKFFLTISRRTSDNNMAVYIDFFTSRFNGLNRGNFRVYGILGNSLSPTLSLVNSFFYLLPVKLKWGNSNGAIGIEIESINSYVQLMYEIKDMSGNASVSIPSSLDSSGFNEMILT